MTETLADLAAQATIIATNTGKVGLDWAKLSPWQREAVHYRVTLHYRTRRLTVDWWQGAGIKHAPWAADVLSSLLSDAECGASSFEDFCAEFGYDEDSRAAERTYHACKAMGPKLRRLLGTDYERFAHAERE